MTLGSQDPETGQEAPAAASQAAEPGTLVSITAEASGDARAYAAGRDVHLHFKDGQAVARRVESGPGTDECPYPGLSAFTMEQSRWYFGRDLLVSQVLTEVADRLDPPAPLVVAAPSGAGKSSLLQAGLAASIREGRLPVAGSRDWPILILTPTGEPMAALASALAPVIDDDPVTLAETLARDPASAADSVRERLDLAHSSDTRVVIVIDQLEELFTAGADETRRTAYIKALTELGTRRHAPRHPAALVVYGVRADYLGHFADSTEIRAAVQRGQILVGAMTAEEARAAIEFPAQRAGLDLEAGLVELLLTELGASGPAGRHESGRLPLLAHALRATWQQRHGSTLTVAGYRATGGIESAVANSAEKAFTSLDASQSAVAHVILLRLIKAGDGAEDSRRSAPFDELVRDTGDPAAATAVVDAFTRARLFTRDESVVQISHEVLLRAWPRLRDWLDADRAAVLIRQGLDEAAGEWERHGEDSARLYRGQQLAAAKLWLAGAAGSGSRPQIGSLAQSFIDASVRQERTSRRIRRAAISTLAALTLVASVVAVYAVQQRSAAQTDSRQAVVSRNDAIFHKVAAEAVNAGSDDVALAAQLDMTAYRMKPDGAVYTDMLTQMNSPVVVAASDQAPSVRSLAASSDGALVAAAGDTLRLWDVSQPGLFRSLPAPSDGKGYSAVAFLPGSRLLIAGSDDGSAQIIDLTDPAHPKVAGQTPPGEHGGVVGMVVAKALGQSAFLLTQKGWETHVNFTDPTHPVVDPSLDSGDGVRSATALSPDGTVAVEAAKDGSLTIWPVKAPAPVKPTATQTDEITGIAFAPDSKSMATASEDNTIQMWDLTDPGKPVAGSLLTGFGQEATAVSYSSDGLSLVAGSKDGNIAVWTTANPTKPAAIGTYLAGTKGSIAALSFLPGRHDFVSAGVDGIVRLWHLPETTVHGPTGPVYSTAFAANGLLAEADSEGYLRLFDLHDPAKPTPLGFVQLLASGQSVNSVEFSPDGRTVAVGGQDGSLMLVDVSDPAKPHMVGQVPAEPTDDVVSSVAFSPDGKLVATGGGNDSDNPGVNHDNSIKLWNVTDPTHPVPAGSPLTGSVTRISSVDFSHDGKLLVSTSHDGSITLWDTSDPAHAHVIAAKFTGATGFAEDAVFSPDGGTVATGGLDAVVRLWDVTDPTNVRELTAPKGLRGHRTGVNEIRFSPDGKRLASASDDHTVRLWDLEKQPPTALGNQIGISADVVNTVAFSTDGRTLVAAGGDEVLWIWPTDEHAVSDILCPYSGHAMDQTAWTTQVSTDLRYDPPCRK